MRNDTVQGPSPVNEKESSKKKSWLRPLRMSNFLILLSVISFVCYWFHLHHWPSIPQQKLLVLIVILCFAIQKIDG
jgi:membrane protein YdbS with pleckstrin-like domain